MSEYTQHINNMYLKIILPRDIGLSPNFVCPKLFPPGAVRSVWRAESAFPCPARAERGGGTALVSGKSSSSGRASNSGTARTKCPERLNFGRCPHGPEKWIRSHPDMMRKVRLDRSNPMGTGPPKGTGPPNGAQRTINMYLRAFRTMFDLSPKFVCPLSSFRTPADETPMLFEQRYQIELPGAV
jgi:hypothetical protein